MGLAALFGVLGRYFVGILALQAEPIIHGLGPMDLVQSWSGRIRLLGMGDLLPWLIGGLGGTAGAVFLLATGKLGQKRPRQGCAVVATLCALAACQLLLYPLQNFDAPWPSIVGFLALAATLGWIAVGGARGLPLGDAERRHALPFALVAAVLFGLPTLVEGWARHSPKDYPPLTIELVPATDEDARYADDSKIMRVPRHQDRSTTERLVVDRDKAMTITQDDVLLLRLETIDGREHLAMHLTFARSGDLLKITSEHVHQRLVMVVNGEPVMAPNILGPLSGGRMILSPAASDPDDPFLALFRKLTEESE